jgi:uncharacterized protein YkwD
MYSIADNNFVKLRDIASLLNGTSAQVNIDYADGTASITTGKAYSKPDGTELKPIGSSAKTAVPTDTRLVVNGSPVTNVTVYMIDDNNWLKVRDLGQTLAFGVSYEASSDVVLINTVNPGGLLLGDTPEAVSSRLGAPYRELYASSGAVYRLYGGYNSFTAVRFEGDFAVFAFTSQTTEAKSPAALYTDKYGGGAVYGVSVGKVLKEDASVTEQLVFELTNAFRAKNGKSALAWNDALASAARAHSQDMAVNNYFSHTGLDGRSVGTRITNSGYKWTAYGENIIYGYGNPFAAVDGWINSEGHRSNMLGGFKDLGVGWSAAGDYGTQDFGRK